MSSASEREQIATAATGPGAPVHKPAAAPESFANRPVWRQACTASALDRSDLFDTTNTPNRTAILPGQSKPCKNDVQAQQAPLTTTAAWTIFKPRQTC